MYNFNYLLDKIKNSDFIEEPFEHLDIRNFLSEEHFLKLQNNKQIHFDESGTQEELRSQLLKNDFIPTPFPGCTTNENLYFSLLKENRLNEIQTEGDSEGVGIAYVLNKTNDDFVKSLLRFLNGNEFHNTLKEKFSITEQTRVTTKIQKYLTGYEISPHPDIRQKSLTYLLNINKDNHSENDQIHTDLLSLKEDYRFIYDYWEKHPKENRAWVSWDWCDIKKTMRENNSIVIFKPSNYSLHAVKLNYDHKKYQRTQIYGNLMFSSPGQYTPQNISKFTKMINEHEK